MNTENLKEQHAGDTLEDHRMAKDALMEVNRNLQTAITACRAIAHDARAIKDVELAKSARRLLRLVKAMKDGPNVSVWTELQIIEKAARALV